MPARSGETDASLGRDAESLHRALSDLARLYQFRDRSQICCHDISVTQCYALEAIVRGGTMTLGALSAHLYLDKSTASRVVDALERKGYLRRSADPADGRAVRLEATRTGAALHGRIERSLIEEEKRLIADFGPEARRAATTVLERLARSAAARFGAGRASCRAPKRASSNRLRHSTRKDAT
jgi:DNA-binding MarR family transcriptional regulator